MRFVREVFVIDKSGTEHSKSNVVQASGSKACVVEYILVVESVKCLSLWSWRSKPKPLRQPTSSEGEFQAMHINVAALLGRWLERRSLLISEVGERGDGFYLTATKGNKGWEGH